MSATFFPEGYCLLAPLEKYKVEDDQHLELRTPNGAAWQAFEFTVNGDLMTLHATDGSFDDGTYIRKK